MARTARLLKGVPDGWCARRAGKGGHGGGVSMDDVEDGSLKTVYYKKFPTKVSKTGPTGATVGVTYGCVGKWREKGKFGKKKGRCDGSMRAVRIMKPKGRVSKSKSKSKYQCGRR